MSESTLLRRLESRGPAAYAVQRARIDAAVARGWVIREGAGGYIAELANRRGIYAASLADLLARVERSASQRSN